MIIYNLWHKNGQCFRAPTKSLKISLKLIFMSRCPFHGGPSSSWLPHYSNPGHNCAALTLLQQWNWCTEIFCLCIFLEVCWKLSNLAAAFGQRPPNPPLPLLLLLLLFNLIHFAFEAQFILNEAAVLIWQKLLNNHIWLIQFLQFILETLQLLTCGSVLNSLLSFLQMRRKQNMLSAEGRQTVYVMGHLLLVLLWSSGRTLL